MVGDIVKTHEPTELPVGQALMADGRISAAAEYEPGKPKLPFSTPELARIDDALTRISRATGLGFQIYLGDLGEDTRATAEQLHAGLDDAANAVLIAVSPGQKAVEIITGEKSHQRLTDRAAKLGVVSMVPLLREANIIGGLIKGLRIMGDLVDVPDLD